MIRKFEFVAKLNSFLHQFVKCKHGRSRSKNSNISWSTFDIIVYTKKGHGTGSNTNSLMFFLDILYKKYITRKKLCIYILTPSLLVPYKLKKILDHSPLYSLSPEWSTWVTENSGYPFTINRSRFYSWKISHVI